MRRRLSRRQAWQGRILQGRALADQCRFDEAIKAYRAALGHVEREAEPRDWAESQIWFGMAVKEQGNLAEGVERGRLFDEAEAAYRGALEVWTEELAPYYRGMALRNLERLEGLR